MLVAEDKLLQPQWEALPKEQNKKKYGKATKKKSRYLLTVLTLFLIGLIILFRYAYIVESNYNLEASKRRLAQIQKETAILKVKLAELRSYDRIEEIALNRLGMQKPSKEQFVFIEAKEKKPSIMSQKQSP